MHFRKWQLTTRRNQYLTKAKLENKTFRLTQEEKCRQKIMFRRPTTVVFSLICIMLNYTNYIVVCSVSFWAKNKQPSYSISL